MVLESHGILMQASAQGVWQPHENALHAVARLNHGGFRVILTHSAPVGTRARFDIETLLEINARLHQRLTELGGAVEALVFCPHQAPERCECRKPKPGLLRGIAERLHIDRHEILVAGSTLADIECAAAAGALPHLVGGIQEDQRLARELYGVPVYADLPALTDDFLHSTG